MLDQLKFNFDKYNLSLTEEQQQAVTVIFAANEFFHAHKGKNTVMLDDLSDFEYRTLMEYARLIQANYRNHKIYWIKDLRGTFNINLVTAKRVVEAVEILYPLNMPNPRPEDQTETFDYSHEVTPPPAPQFPSAPIAPLAQWEQELLNSQPPF